MGVPARSPKRDRKAAREEAQRLREREEGFDLRGLETTSLPEYNALCDPNLRHYFENERVIAPLKKSGLIDRQGRVIDLDKNKIRLHIIEQEFKCIEKQIHRAENGQEMAQGIQNAKKRLEIEHRKLQKRIDVQKGRQISPQRSNRNGASPTSKSPRKGRNPYEELPTSPRTSRKAISPNARRSPRRTPRGKPSVKPSAEPAPTTDLQQQTLTAKSTAPEAQEMVASGEGTTPSNTNDIQQTEPQQGQEVAESHGNSEATDAPAPQETAGGGGGGDQQAPTADPAQ